MATKNTNQLVPVQRQITRGGKTFMTTVWVKPRHASSSTSSTIEVPDWEFKSSKGFQDEFDRINKMRDKTARQFLKQQLLEHVEKNIGVKYNKVPDSDPRAFVKNSLRGFSAAKKHLDEGKGYAVKVEKQADGTEKKKGKKEKPPEKKSRKKKLPTPVAEAYDRATPISKAVALATGIVAEDAETENWLLERLVKGEMDTHGVSAIGNKSRLEGSQDFSHAVDHLEYAVTNIGRGFNRLSENMVDNGFNTVGTAIRDTLTHTQRDEIREGKKKLSDFADELVSKIHHNNSHDRVLFPDGYKGQQIKDTVANLVANYEDYGKLLIDAHKFDTISRASVESERNPDIFLENVELKVNRGIDVANYMENLIDIHGKAPKDIEYADLAQRQLDLGERMSSLSTDEFWEEFEMDKFLNNIDPSVLRRYKADVSRTPDQVGGDIEVMMNAFAMTNIHNYQGHNSNASELADAVWETFHYGIHKATESSQELRKLHEKVTETVKSSRMEVPTVAGIKREYEKGNLTKDEVRKLIQPGLQKVTEGTKSQRLKVEVDNKEVAANTGSTKGQKPFVDMTIDPGMDSRGRKLFSSWGVYTYGGMLSDPFAAVRRNAEFGAQTEGDTDLNVVGTEAEIKATAKARREKGEKLKRKALEIQSDKKLRNDAFRLAIATNISEHDNMRNTSSSSKINKFREGIGSQEITLPTDEFLNDGRISMATKLRYASRMSITPERSKERVQRELDMEVSRKHGISMPGIDPSKINGKETKANKLKRVQNEMANAVNKLTKGQSGASVEDLKEALSAIKPLEAEELTKAAVKTSIGAVKGDTLKEITKGVVNTHDKVHHSSFSPTVHGVYEVKTSIKDPEYDAKKAELSGGETRMMYHGTSFATSQLIFGESGGFKVFQGGKNIKSGSMLGYGVYLADKSSKSAQYISNRGFSRSSDRGALMVCESYLGKVETYNRFEHMGVSHKGQNYDTIEALVGNSNLKNNEWLVTTAEQARPKYIIDYERKRKG